MGASKPFDRITAPRTRLEIDMLLSEVGRKNAPEVGVAGLHFRVERPGRVRSFCL